MSLDYKIHKNWNMRNICCAILLFLFATQVVNADDKDPNSPIEFLRTRWDAIFSVLQTKDIEQKEKECQIDKIMGPIFDFSLMAKLALGRVNWSKLKPAQQEEFSRLFVERLKNSYREKIMLYTDEKALFKSSVQKKKSVYVQMELISKEKNVPILYKLREVDKHWKIYDVEIQGISILLTYRSQFDYILRHGTVEDLLSRLRKPPVD